MEISIRKPMFRDKDKIKKFLTLLANDFIPPLAIGGIEEEASAISKRQAPALVALLSRNRIIGIVIWSSYPRNEKYGYIRYIGVHPKYRKRGIGKKLMNLTIEKIKKSGYLGLYYTTWYANVAMRRLSESLGMVTVRVYADKGYRGPGGKTALYRLGFIRE